MPFILRTLSIRDVVRALEHRDPGLALRIGQNLCSNAVNSVRFRLRSSSSIRRALRRWS